MVTGAKEVVGGALEWRCRQGRICGWWPKGVAGNEMLGSEPTSKVGSGQGGG